MAEILSSVVKPAMEELGRVTLVKIKHLFTYLCCFNSNIQGLMDEAQKLENARVGLQREVVAAENDAQQILPEVRTWLGKASDKIQVDEKGIEDEIPTVKNGCWGIKSRYILSRKAVKLTGEMKQLMEDRNRFNHISTPPLPIAQAEIPMGTTYDFQSRKQIEEDIMKALKAKKVTTIGICGMGGVGKTTMAKRIMVRVKKENIFQEIFMVVVSQPVDLLKIQGAIAESLSLNLGEETLLARATKLHARLTSEKRILIVFDDVWEKLKLEDLGIPCKNERCTVLLTSRNKDVLRKMDAQNVYGVETLSDEEAWLLFKEKVGPCVDDTNLLSIAKQVARECKGLPIALVTIAGALKDQTSIAVWKNDLQQLKSFNPEDITEDMGDVIKDVYNPLKLSYTKLEDRHARSLFLLCSLFPEDADISLEELTSYCFGLQMFPNLDFSNASEGILEKVRRKVFARVETLKNRFLLLESEYKGFVRMHDVVRDVAIYIASHEAKEGTIVDVKFNSMPLSSECTYHWGSVFSVKTSNFLRLHVWWGRRYEIKDFSIFEGIKQLSLLSFDYILMKSIPLEIQLLKNLRTLRLVHCKLESFSMVGKLLSLEILDCFGCVGIGELPVEIGNLNQLKKLNFTDCRSLRRIPPGVVSNLVELEEFKMLNSFDGWELAEAEVLKQERRNACLNEFTNLSKLNCLEIGIRDFNLAAEEIRFSPNIVRYHIHIGDPGYYHDQYAMLKRMCVKLPYISLGSWVVKFLKSADQLELYGDGSSPLDLRQSHNMKSLSVDDPSEFDVFPILERLSLRQLPNLEEIYDGTVSDQSNSFRNLQRLELDDLPALKHLWKRSNRSIVSLDNLREIRIANCNKLDSLFPFTNSIGTDQISTAARNVDELLCTGTVFFPMLEEISLSGLDKLEVIWNSPIQNQRSHSFKNLWTLSLNDLRSMTHLWKSSNLSALLSNLSHILIDRCHKLRNIFSSTIISMDFPSQLTGIIIINCEMMEEVVLNENQENQYCAIHFPKLLMLELQSLESLTAFAKGVESVEFPMLEKLNIIKCPNLMSLLSSGISNQDSANNHDKYASHLFCNQKVFFPMLEEMYLSGLDKLEVIWNSPIQNERSHSFKNLRKLRLIDLRSMTHLWKSSNLSVLLSNLSQIRIDGCHKLRNIFSSTIISMDFLSQLTKIKIIDCEMMEEVVLNENEENQCCAIHFSKLLKLKLESLESLTAFAKGVESVEFPMLEELNIIKCPNLMSLLSSGISNQDSANNHDKYASHLFCNQKISFGNLKTVSIGMAGEQNIWCNQIPSGFFRQLEKLEIDTCTKIRSLFSFSIAGNLTNLNILKISECEEMVKVIEDDEKMTLCENSRTLFPSLKELKLWNLPKLECFANWRCDLFELPSLVEMEILDCPLLQFFTIKSVRTPKLERIIIDALKKAVGDLNDAIQLHFETNQRGQLISPQEESTSTKASEVEERSQIEEKEIEKVFSNN